MIYSYLRNPLPPPGKCIYCGCDQSGAHTLPTGEPCAWLDHLRIVCTHPGCVAAHAVKTKQFRRASLDAQRKYWKSPEERLRAQREKRREKKNAANRAWRARQKAKREAEQHKDGFRSGGHAA